MPRPQDAAATEVIDPVCGMTIDPKDAVGHADYDGRTYYFCSASCLQQFRANPKKFLEPASTPATAPVPAPGEYTCPMHPEIVRNEPGSCPICGMALEPRSVSLDERNPELEDMTRRFWISAALTVPSVLLAMGEYVPGRPLDALVAPGAMNWAQLALTTPVVAWGGWPFFVRGWQSLVNRSLNMFTLIALGVGVAYVYSVVATAFPALFPASFRMESAKSACTSRRRRSS